ncbi:protein of unknown function (plasmid) [Rhodovastum atsumiense]|nr:protein of unknown function [Rhodovastum atsumiense]
MIATLLRPASRSTGRTIVFWLRRLQAGHHEQAAGIGFRVHTRRLFGRNESVPDAEPRLAATISRPVVAVLDSNVAQYGLAGNRT